MPLLAAQRYSDLDESGAYAISFVLVAIAILLHHRGRRCSDRTDER